jgi:hypothetical protein
MQDLTPFPRVDASLAQRLEATEGTSSANFVTARAAAVPECGSRWERIAGAWAIYDGPQSPLTQTFGLGLFEPPTEASLDAVERFFLEQDVPLAHEVSPLADPSILALFPARGYRVTELTSVMYRPIGRDVSFPRPRGTSVTARVATDGEHDLWADTAAMGWAEHPELESFLRDIGRVNRHNRSSVTFLAECDGQAVAAGALYLASNVALLAGASTIPAFRRQGAQLALLECRLRLAAERGCDLAMTCARPGSASQHNAERNGFRIAYTRLKWERPR